MRTVNFKGMIVLQPDDEHFEIVGPHPTHSGVRTFSFQMPPPFMRWPAKTVILAAILADILFTSLFFWNSTDVFTCVILGSICVSLLFVIGYVQESFPAIFSHLFSCICYTGFCIILVPVVYYNQTVCTDAAVCKSIHEWMAYIEAPITPTSAYVFLIVSIISHIFMIPISLRMMKYAAACQALEIMLAEEEKEMKKEEQKLDWIFMPHHI